MPISVLWSQVHPPDVYSDWRSSHAADHDSFVKENHPNYLWVTALTPRVCKLSDRFNVLMGCSQIGLPTVQELETGPIRSSGSAAVVNVGGAYNRGPTISSNNGSA